MAAWDPGTSKHLPQCVRASCINKGELKQYHSSCALPTAGCAQEQAGAPAACGRGAACPGHGARTRRCGPAPPRPQAQTCMAESMLSGLPSLQAAYGILDLEVHMCSTPSHCEPQISREQAIPGRQLRGLATKGEGCPAPTRCARRPPQNAARRARRAGTPRCGGGPPRGGP